MLITFTGLDVRTPIMPLAELLRDYPGIELGILWSVKRSGRGEPRYPTLQQIGTLLDLLPADRPPRLAIHFCGGPARQALFEGKNQHLFRRPNLRLQINGRVSEEDLRAVADTYYTQQTIITQHAPSFDLCTVPLANHAILMDASGGRGRLPDQWWRPKIRKKVGFAGGLGPETLADHLPQIWALAQRGDWLDMESRIRTDDWFDLEKVRTVCEIVDRYRREASCPSS